MIWIHATTDELDGNRASQWVGNSILSYDYTKVTPYLSLRDAMGKSRVLSDRIHIANSIFWLGGILHVQWNDVTFRFREVREPWNIC